MEMSLMCMAGRGLSGLQLFCFILLEGHVARTVCVVRTHGSRRAPRESRRSQTKIPKRHIVLCHMLVFSIE